MFTNIMESITLYDIQDLIHVGFLARPDQGFLEKKLPAIYHISLLNSSDTVQDIIDILVKDSIFTNII